MPAALAALFGAAFTVAACYATGALVVAALGIALTRPEKYPLAFVLGAGCMHLALFAILAMKIAYKPVLFILLAGAVAAAIRTGAWRLGNAPAKSSERIGFGSIFFGLIAGAFTILYFVNAWAPEASPDGSGYHLALVARYLRARGFERITTNMYAGLGQGVEMLFVPAFAFGRHSAAALVHFAFAIALALAILAYGRRIGKPWVGAAAALLTFLSPIVGKDGTSAYIDVAVAAIVFSVFYWLEIWDGARDARLLIPVGLMAGYAYAAKYTAFVMLLYALGFVAWRARRVKSLLVVCSCAAVMIVPWTIKDWVYLRNPIAPFGNQSFRNPYFHVSSEQEYAEWLRHYDVKNKWTLPIEATVRGQATQGLIGPVFLVAPLALLALRYRAGRRLLAAGFVLLATYPANVGTRFLIPCLPFLSLAMALALANVRWLLALLVLFHAVTSWPAVIPRYADRYAWRLERFPYRAALRRIPEDRYLRETNPSYAVARMIEAKVPPGERVLAMNPLPESYTSREILVGYEAPLNSMLADGIYMAWNFSDQPSRMFVFRFPAREMRRVRLLQTAQGMGMQQWSVYELRFLSGGVELHRKPEWRLRAFPNPWEVQLAFDNSETTRWKSWETAAPGMYIEANFGRAEGVDEVEMETSRASEWPIRLEVQTMDAQGRWVKVSGNPEERSVTPRGSIRRAATYEMRARGVNYLLMADSDWGTDEYNGDAAAWGLTAIARESGVTLYRVNP
jgi:hypothetical protein